MVDLRDYIRKGSAPDHKSKVDALVPRARFTQHDEFRAPPVEHAVTRGAPKRVTVPAVHDGMHHRTDGTLNVGISRTQAASALEGGKLPTDPPKVVKQLTIPKAVPGQRSRTAGHETGPRAPGVAHASRTTEGVKAIDEAFTKGRL